MTTNAINSLSSIYMILYPFAVQFAFKFFEDRKQDDEQHQGGDGLRRGILIGASLNALAGAVRWLGATPSTLGFFILFTGQTIGAIGNDLL
jgi:hypothetical protein